MAPFFFAAIDGEAGNTEPFEMERIRSLQGAAGLVFEEHAGVLDDEEAGGVRFGCGGFVGNSLLEPEGFRVDSDGGIGHARNVLGAAEDVDDIYGERNVFEAGVGFFAQDFGLVGIDGDDLIAGGLEVGSNAVGGTETTGREADDGDGFGVTEEIANWIWRLGSVFGELEKHGDSMSVNVEE